jgi:glycosyltransferase involved in cell wall biosynthesis
MTPEVGAVGLIARPGDHATGLGRYATALAEALGQLGVAVRPGKVLNPLPRSLTRLLALTGRDAETFFSNYGVRAEMPPADLYHLTSEYHAPLLKRHEQIPTVVTVNGFLSFLLRRRPALRMKRTLVEVLFDRLVIRGLRKADAVIAVSAYVKSQLVNQAGLRQESIHVVPEGVDTRVFSPRPVPAEVWARYRLPAGRRWLLYVGSEQPRKNFVALVQAFAELRRTRPDLALLKVGDPEIPDERRRAISVAADLGVLEDIHFVGHAAKDLPDLFNMADLFVFPSLCEGFGLPPLEAMACGTPVVCSNAASLPEVVGDAAVMCEPNARALAAAMARVLDNPDYASELVQAGRRRSKELSWQRVAEATKLVYLEVRERRNSVPGVRPCAA